ncbi:restriction endonuclease subunit S [Streptococcus suis]|nr:restriction endonuclease subunit S [Streptococcus suis]
MTRMKDSGIEWIGEIPEEWGIKPIKHIFGAIGSGTTPDSSKVEYYDGNINWLQSGDLYKKDYVYAVSKTITDLGYRSSASLRIYQAPFLAIAMYGASIGNLAISKIDACVNQAVAVLKGEENIVRFAKLALEISKTELIFAAQGGTQPNINQVLIKNWVIPFPSEIEIKKIADFLDKKVAQLDKVKSLLEEQIKTLEDYRQSLIYETVTKGLDKNVPLKDSGVDWIGQIPEGWGVSRLDMYVAIYGRIGFRGYTSSDIVEEGEGAISLSPSNIVEHKVVNYNNTYVSWDKYDESPEIQVQEGNILYVKTGSSYGKAGLVTSLSEKSTINPQLVIFKCRKYVEARYINYLLNCQLGKDQSELIVGGSTIPTISQEKLRKMQFPYISFDDQNQIANFLDKKTEQINQMIAIKKEQIENINKQRQTLIYDYVTGKRRV